MKANRFRMRFFICLVALVLVAGLAGACAEPAPAPTPTPPAPTPTPPAPTPPPPPPPTPTPTPPPPPPPPPPPEPEVIELILASNIPPMAPPAAAVNDWIMKLEADSGGRVKFTPYWAGSLFESKEALQSFLAGIADCGSLWMGDFPSVFVLNQYTSLPFMGYPSAQVGTRIYREMYDKYPELREEYQGLKVLYPTMWSEEFGWLHTTNKAITTAEQMKGLKTVGLAELIVEWEKNMGAVPVMVAVEDTYTSLERGLVEAELTGFARIVGGHSTIDLFEYHTKIGGPYSLGYNPMVFNPDSWNRLPDDIKKMIEDMTPWFTENRIKKEVEGGRSGEQVGRDRGHTFVDLEPGEFQKFLDAALPVHQTWIDSVEAKGLPAQALYDDVKRLIEEYS